MPIINLRTGAKMVGVSKQPIVPPHPPHPNLFGTVYQAKNPPTTNVTTSNQIPNGCRDGDSTRNAEAKLDIRSTNYSNPVKLIFILGGHGRAIYNSYNTTVPISLPNCITVFPNYFGEKAVSGKSKHTIAANIVREVNAVTTPVTPVTPVTPGTIIDILESNDVQEIRGKCPITVHRPNEPMNDLMLFGKGSVHSDDFCSLRRNPSCFYKFDVTANTLDDLAPKYFTDNIDDWIRDTNTNVTAWRGRNPALATGPTLIQMQHVIKEFPVSLPAPDKPHYVKTNGDRVTLGYIRDIISQEIALAKVTDQSITPDMCILYCIACRTCGGFGRTLSGGKTKKRRHRNRTRSRQMSRHARTKRK
jgi:hypothetical protein